MYRVPDLALGPGTEWCGSRASEGHTLPGGRQGILLLCVTAERMTVKSEQLIDKKRGGGKLGGTSPLA